MSEAREKLLREALERTATHMEAIARRLEGSGFSAIDHRTVRVWREDIHKLLAAAPESQSGMTFEKWWKENGYRLMCADNDYGVVAKEAWEAALSTKEQQ